MKIYTGSEALHPHAFGGFTMVFDLLNTGRVGLAALDAGEASKMFAGSTVIIPSNWEQTEASDLPNGWVKYYSQDPFNIEDVTRVCEFIESLNKAMEVMRK